MRLSPFPPFPPPVSEIKDLRLVWFPRREQKRQCVAFILLFKKRKWWKKCRNARYLSTPSPPSRLPSPHPSLTSCNKRWDLCCHLMYIDSYCACFLSRDAHYTITHTHTHIHTSTNTQTHTQTHIHTNTFPSLLYQICSFKFDSRGILCPSPSSVIPKFVWYSCLTSVLSPASCSLHPVVHPVIVPTDKGQHRDPLSVAYIYSKVEDHGSSSSCSVFCGIEEDVCFDGGLVCTSVFSRSCICVCV